MNKIKQAISSFSSPTITLGSAVSGYNTIGSSYGDGDELTFVCVQGDDYQICRGTYTASGTTLAIDTILEKSVSGIVTSLPGTGLTLTSSDEILVGDTAFDTIGFFQDTPPNSYYFLPHNVSLYSDAFATPDNKLSGIPVVFHWPVLVSEVGAEVAQASASETFYVGLYKAISNGDIGDYVLGSAELDAGTTGIKMTTLGSSVLVPAGCYYAFFICSTGSAVRFRAPHATNRDFGANFMGVSVPTRSVNSPYFTASYAALSTSALGTPTGYQTTLPGGIIFR